MVNSHLKEVLHTHDGGTGSTVSTRTRVEHTKSRQALEMFAGTAAVVGGGVVAHEVLDQPTSAGATSSETHNLEPGNASDQRLQELEDGSQYVNSNLQIDAQETSVPTATPESPDIGSLATPSSQLGSFNNDNSLQALGSASSSESNGSSETTDSGSALAQLGSMGGSMTESQDGTAAPSTGESAAVTTTLPEVIEDQIDTPNALIEEPYSREVLRVKETTITRCLNCSTLTSQEINDITQKANADWNAALETAGEQGFPRNYYFIAHDATPNLLAGTSYTERIRNTGYSLDKSQPSSIDAVMMGFWNGMQGEKMVIRFISGDTHTLLVGDFSAIEEFGPDVEFGGEVAEYDSANDVSPYSRTFFDRELKSELPAPGAQYPPDGSTDRLVNQVLSEYPIGTQVSYKLPVYYNIGNYDAEKNGIYTDYLQALYDAAIKGAEVPNPLDPAYGEVGYDFQNMIIPMNTNLGFPKNSSISTGG